MKRPCWRIGGGEVLDPNQGTLIMGILNATPDSFSDGGRYLSEGAAVEQGLLLREEGADLVDVGGESTRPGAGEVDEAEELGRVVGVVERLAGEGVRVSINTSKPGVAQRCIEAGAVAVNDVAALESDGMAGLCASAGVGVVLMHMRGSPRTMQIDPVYRDVSGEVRGYLRMRTEAAAAAGVDPQAVAVDPGIGFGKNLEHNLALLAGLADLASDGAPVLVGASRKAFLGALTGRPVGERDGVTAVSSAVCALYGASIVRVHDVAATRDALLLADAIVRAGSKGEDDVRNGYTAINRSPAGCRQHRHGARGAGG